MGAGVNRKVVLDRGEIPELRMASLTVVDDLDVVEYGVGKIQPSAPFLSIEKLDLRARPK